MGSFPSLVFRLMCVKEVVYLCVHSFSLIEQYILLLETTNQQLLIDFNFLWSTYTLDKELFLAIQLNVNKTKLFVLVKGCNFCEVCAKMYGTCSTFM